MLTYFSILFSGDSDALRIWLLVGAVIGGLAVGIGIFWEAHKLTLATSLVLLGVVAEAICTIFLFVIDEGISRAQQSTIIALERRIAPRLITQAQQNELTARLSEFKNQRGTIIASPSTPESEWFARVLAAPLKEAGWGIEILPGTATATVLFPTGTVVSYAVDVSRSVISPEKTELASAAISLVEKLREYGIDATAVPGVIKGPNTIEITISTK